MSHGFVFGFHAYIAAFAAAVVVAAAIPLRFPFVDCLRPKSV